MLCRKRSIANSGAPELLLFSLQSKTSMSRSASLSMAVFGVVTSSHARPWVVPIETTPAIDPDDVTEGP
jgi:hypothetical protein